MKHKILLPLALLFSMALLITLGGCYHGGYSSVSVSSGYYGGGYRGGYWGAPPRARSHRNYRHRAYKRPPVHRKHGHTMGRPHRPKSQPRHGGGGRSRGGGRRR